MNQHLYCFVCYVNLSFILFVQTLTCWVSYVAGVEWMNFWISIFDAKCDVRERILNIMYEFTRYEEQEFGLHWDVCVRKNVHIINNNNWKWFAPSSQKWKRCKTEEKKQREENEQREIKKKIRNKMLKMISNGFTERFAMIDTYSNYFNGSMAWREHSNKSSILISILWI